MRNTIPLLGTCRVVGALGMLSFLTTFAPAFTLTLALTFFLGLVLAFGLEGVVFAIF
jgi:hypothetical protein